MAYRKTVTLTVDSTNSGSIVSKVTNRSLNLTEARNGEAIATKQVDPFGDGRYYIGQFTSLFDVYIYVVGMSFSVSSIPSNAVIKDVKLKITVPTFSFVGEEYVNLLLVKYDWGSGSLSAANDYIALDTLNNQETYPILGSRNSQFIFFPPNFDSSFLCTQDMIDYVQTLVGGSNPIRLWLVDQDSLTGKMQEFFARAVKGMPVIVGEVEDSRFYSFARTDVSLIVTYEQPGQ